jgi:hypothetical protein
MFFHAVFSKSILVVLFWIFKHIFIQIDLCDDHQKRPFVPPTNTSRADWARPGQLVTTQRAFDNTWAGSVQLEVRLGKHLQKQTERLRMSHRSVEHINWIWNGAVPFAAPLPLTWNIIQGMTACRKDRATGKRQCQYFTFLLQGDHMTQPVRDFLSPVRRCT